MEVFNKIDRILKQKKISTRQLISGIGITPPGYYSMVRNNDIKLSTLLNICNYLKVDIKEFLTSELADVTNISEQNLNNEYKKASSSTNNELIQKDLDHIKTLIKHIEHNL
jgi:DNA-binding Xre family transcriptional regulator